MASFKYGFLVGVMTLCSLGIIFALITILFAHRYLEDRLYLSNAAIYTSVDFGVIRDENKMKFVDPNKADVTFRRALQNTFDLDGNLQPTPDTPKLIAGQVTVERLNTKDEDEPLTLGGVALNRNTAVHSVIRVPIKIPYIPFVINSRVAAITILPTSY